MKDRLDLDQLLRAEDGDAGCAAGREILGVYVEMELAGEDPASIFPGTAIHLEACRSCRADYDGLLEAVRQFGDIEPDL